MISRARHEEDRGSISVMVAVLAVGLLAVVGLVVDGGGKAKALARADDVAAAAGRCGTSAVDLGSVRTGTVRINPTLAAHRARACLTKAGMTGKVTVTDGGRTLTVTAVEDYKPVFLSILGVGTSDVHGRAVVELHEVQQGEIQ